MRCIEKELDQNNCLTDEFLLKANDKDTLQFESVEILLKGLETSLPDGNSFKDGYGQDRYDVRVKWWDESAKTLKDFAIVPKYVFETLPDIKLSTEHLNNFIYDPDAKPVFFGHYWFTGEPKAQTHNVACLDYSVAKNDKLVSYRWDHRDKKLSNDKFISIECV